MTDLLVRSARIVPLDTAPAHEVRPLDLLIVDGTLEEVGEQIEARDGIPELDAGGRWALPGLWDHHVHMTQWGLSTSRLDTGAAASVAEVQALVRERVTRPLPPTGVITGWGHRCATWPLQPTVVALDEVTTEVPVVLISGDGHHGWLNTPALRLLDAPPTTGVIAEGPWFATYDRLSRLPGAQEEGEAGVAEAIRAAHRLGVVGITDLEFGRPWAQWRERKEEGMPQVRARVGVYPEGLDEVLAAGARSGDVVSGTRGLVTLGPFKVISDGSLNTRTAWCCQPYADAHLLEHPHGAPNLSGEELREAMATAHGAGLYMAIHAIGDAATRQALGAFEATGAHGGIEHAQLVDTEDLRRWARLPVRASVQPAHLLDDRTVTERCWPDRTGRTFALRSFLDHGIELALGSDAPVSPLDPWLAMAAAVHRGPVGEDSWHPEQELTVREALAASVDGQRLVAGGRGDLVLVDEDPFPPAGTGSAERAAHLLRTHVAVTVIDGRVVHSDGL